MTTYQDLYRYAYKIVSHYHEIKDGVFHTDWNDISLHDKEALAAMFIEYDDRDLLSIYENQNYDDIVSSLLNMMKKDDAESKEDFTDCLRNNIVKFYEKHMMKLIEEATIEYETNDRISSGLVQRKYADNGETYWSRSWKISSHAKKEWKDLNELIGKS